MLEGMGHRVTQVLDGYYRDGKKEWVLNGTPT